MPGPRDVLTPDALALLQTIADSGSFAAAARLRNMVPSALTYRVRQIEEALDVLLFDRSARQARLTAAGAELLRESVHVLAEIDALAHRVRRVATGWETQFTIAVDSTIHRATVMDLCDAFLQMNPPTRLKLRSETLSGTLEALSCGQADLALGVVMEDNTQTGLLREALGVVDFVFALAPHHPLAKKTEPLKDAEIRAQRAVAIADSAQQGEGITIGLQAGQDVFTVADMTSKIDAQIRGIGIGFLPWVLARPHVDAGRLVTKKVERPAQQIHSSYAWRNTQNPGRALQWWLAQLQNPVTRQALLGERPNASR